MPLLPSHLLIQTHSLTQLTLSFLLLTSPSTLLSSIPVWIMGESMHIRPFDPTPARTTSSRNPLSTTPSPQPTILPSHPLALASLILALSAITQSMLASNLTTTPTRPNPTRPKTDAEMRAEKESLGEKVYLLRHTQSQWMGLAGVRVVLMGMLVGWIYLFQSSRNEKGHNILGSSSKALYGGQQSGGMGLLANGVVFTGALTDMLFWGYVWTVLREEGREVAKMVVAWRDENRE